MKNLFDPATASEVKERIARIAPDSERQWGTMTAPQMLAHLAAAMEMACGDVKPPRVFAGRLFGPIVKRLMVRNDKPMARNAPTAKELVVSDPRDLERERARLTTLVERFASGGAGACTTHPHTFFGRMTPEEWAVLMYKHCDHHLRQFGV